MRINQDYGDDGNYDFNDEMVTVASHCNKFTRRRDVNSFNMSNYQSCENCGHYTADSRCGIKLENRFTPMQ